jgi:hypothetical protein
MRERGQASVEWLAVMAGAIALAAGLAAATPSVATHVTGGMQAMICHVVGGACDAQAAEQPPAAAPASPPTTAPATPPKGDYCGSGWFNAPELWFTSACAGHDACYAAHRGKAACDTGFLHDMLAECEHVGSSSGGVRSGVTLASCRAAAHLYYKAVVIGGGPSYCHRALCRDE